MMTPAIDPEYDQLLHKIQPRVPTNRRENERLLAEIEALMKKGLRSGNLWVTQGWD